MTILFYDGFDHYETGSGGTHLLRGGWTEGQLMNDCIVASVIPGVPDRFPDYAGKVARSFTSGGNYLGKQDFGAQTQWTVGRAYYQNQADAVNFTFFENWDAAALQSYVYVNAVGQFAIYDASAALQITSTQVFESNAWQYVEIVTVASATVGSITVYVDGAQWITKTGMNTTDTGSLSGLRLKGDTDKDWIMDDVYVSDSTTILGSPRVITLFPNLDDGTNDWTVSSGSANHYTYVDETLADDADYLESNTVGQQDEWQYDDLPSGAKTIFSVSPQIRQEKQDANTPKLKVYIDSGGTLDNITAGLVTTDSFTYIGDSYDLDGDGAGWTQTKVDAIKTKIEYESLT